MSNTSMEFYDHQPGNGTRYPCWFGRTEDDKWVLVWSRDGGASGKAFIFKNDGMLHYNYLMEKLSINEGDAAGLMPLISEVTGRLCALPPGFAINGCYDGGEEPRYI